MFFSFFHRFGNPFGFYFIAICTLYLRPFNIKTVFRIFFRTGRGDVCITEGKTFGKIIGKFQRGIVIKILGKKFVKSIFQDLVGFSLKDQCVDGVTERTFFYFPDAFPKIMVLTRRPEKAKDLISFTESGITIRFSFTLSSFFEKAFSAIFFYRIWNNNIFRVSIII